MIGQMLPPVFSPALNKPTLRLALSTHAAALLTIAGSFNPTTLRDWHVRQATKQRTQNSR